MRILLKIKTVDVEDGRDIQIEGRGEHCGVQPWRRAGRHSYSNYSSCKEFPAPSHSSVHGSRRRWKGRQGATHIRAYTNPSMPQFPDVTAVERAPLPSESSLPPSPPPTSKRIVARGICLRPNEWDYLPSNRRRLSDRGPRQGRQSRVPGYQRHICARGRARSR